MEEQRRPLAEGEKGLAGLSEHLHDLLNRFHPEVAGRFSEGEMEAVAGEFLAEASVRRWIEGQAEKAQMKAMDFAEGAPLELILAQEVAAMWVGICRGLLEDTPNYSETQFDAARVGGGPRVVMEVGLPGASETFTVTVQRHGPGVLTPHEARMKAEDAVAATWKWIAKANAGPGGKPEDLAIVLSGLGFLPPTGEDE